MQLIVYTSHRLTPLLYQHIRFFNKALRQNNQNNPLHPPLHNLNKMFYLLPCIAEVRIVSFSAATSAKIFLMIFVPTKDSLHF
jgi:hypothetical protein